MSNDILIEEGDGYSIYQIKPAYIGQVIKCPFGCKDSEEKQIISYNHGYQYYEKQCLICKKNYGYWQSSD